MTRDSLSTYGVASGSQPDHARPVWPDGVVHHGLRLLLLVVMAGAITALFLPMGTSTLGQYQVGEVLSEGVIAEVDFSKTNKTLKTTFKTNRRTLSEAGTSLISHH